MPIRFDESTVLAVPSAQPFAAAPGGAVDAAPHDDALPLAEDAAYKAFVKNELKHCTLENTASTTASITQQVREETSCRIAYVKMQLQRLSPATQRQLNAAAPKKTSKFLQWWSWRRLTDATCGLADAYTWQRGSARMAGSMRYISAARCPGGPAQEMGYLLYAMAKGDVDAMVRRLQDTTPYGGLRLAALPAARANVRRMRARAPENALFNEECHHCVLSDADWRRVDQRLLAFEAASRGLGAAVCAAWPKLKEHLEATADTTCAPLLQRHLASSLETLPRPFKASEDSTDLRQHPPAKDADYASFIEPIIDACRPDESLRYSNMDYEERYTSCLQGRLSTVSANADGQLTQRWRSYVDALCKAEQQLVDASLSDRVTSVMPFWTSHVASLQCAPLAYARGLFMFHALQHDEIDGFVRQVHSRQHWAQQVRRGLAEARAKLDAPRCTENFEQWDRTCRPRHLYAIKTRQLKRSLIRIESSASMLANASCDAWPQLTKALGGSSECAHIMTSFYLSYGHFIGLNAEPEPRSP